MCVMDLAFDFYPKGSENEAEGGQNVPNQNENVYRGNDNQNPNVKLSLDNNEYKNEAIKNNVIMSNIQGNGNLNEIDQLVQQVKAVNASKRILKKTVEITTKITYTYEDGSTKVVNETKSHVFE